MIILKNVLHVYINQVKYEVHVVDVVAGTCNTNFKAI